MRMVRVLLLAGAASVWSSPVLAADALKHGPAPAWVHPQAIPAAKASDAPIQLLLEDEQIALEPGKVTSYSEGAIKIQNSQGLAAGNLAFVWQPETETITVNKLQIIRGGKVIDVLAGGQTFTILRRETNLDAATLDGRLTATIQPEGLQEGDVLVLATTTERSDPVMKGHVEAIFAAWGGLPIALAHASVQWPTSLHLDARETPNLPGARRSTAKGITTLEVSGTNVQPLVAPKGAPERFRVGRLAEVTDYSSWSDIADLMAPLFRTASAIPASGPLHDEVEKIRSASSDPLTRATQALALVQDRVRYVALLMGEGGYVPASAEQTWARRFGDCKAKTALLLGILHSLGVEAEPVLAQTKIGDMVADRLPMIHLFNHVLVRAHVSGKDYWLDGTRTGDTDLNAIQIPDFGWGLPLVEHAQLVHMIPRPLDRPSVEHRVAIDASAGVYTDAAITIQEIFRGDSAVGLSTVFSSATPEQVDEAMHDKATSYFDGFKVTSSSRHFDKAKREFEYTIKGTAKLGWRDSWFTVPTSSIGYDPDFDRPAGPLHDVPIAVAYPSFVKDQAVIRLPAGFAAAQKLSAPVHETLAGIDYARTETVSSDSLTVDSSERSIVPEVPYKDALAAEPRLRSLDKDDIYLSVAPAYAPTAKDVSALKDSRPTSADDYFVRAGAEIANHDDDSGLADLTAGLALDPKNAWAIRKRSYIYGKKGDFDAATKDLDALETIEPGNVLDLNLRAFMAEKKHDYAGAAAWDQKVLDKDPRNTFALTGRGMMLIRLNRYDEALVSLNSALAIDPKNVLALVHRATAEEKKGDLDAADRDAKAALAIKPNMYAAYDVQGRVAEDRGDFKSAVQFYSSEFDRAKADGVKDAVAFLWPRAKALAALGRDDDALADTDQLIRAGRKDADMRMVRANIYLMRGNRAAVAAEAQAMMADQPKSDFAFVAAGKIYGALGERDEAMAAFAKALAIHPYPYIYLNRSQVRASTDVAGRMADLDAALKLDPNDADTLAEKARLMLTSGDYTGALNALNRIKPDANNDSAELQRAIVLYKAGRTDDAGKLFAKLRASAKTGVALNNLCWEKATAGIMLDSAVQDCRDALKLNPAIGSFEDSLGMALLKSGKLDEALDAYNTAIGKRTGAASLMGRAFVYLRKGDRANAEADAAAARKIDAGIGDVFAAYGLKFGERPKTATASAAK